MKFPFRNDFLVYTLWSAKFYVKQWNLLDCLLSKEVSDKSVFNLVQHSYI